MDKELSNILSGFTKALDKLDKYAKRQYNFAMKRRDDAGVALIEANEAQDNQEQAERVRDNLLQLLGESK